MSSPEGVSSKLWHDLLKQHAASPTETTVKRQVTKKTMNVIDFIFACSRERWIGWEVVREEGDGL